jgi:hypothetical protein
MRRTAVFVALSALLFPLVTSPADAITNGRAKNYTDHYDQFNKGRFLTARININNGERTCSGVLLDGDVLNMPTYHGNNWVLTASSCFADDPATDYHVPAGPPKKPATVRTDSDDTTDAGVDHAITYLVPRQDRDLVLAAVDNAEALASAHIAFSAPRVGETLTTAGYGRTATDWAPIRAQIGQVKVNSVTATAVNVGGGSSVCKGDAGGPLYREVGDRFEIVGVHGVSWQQGCFGSQETRNGSTDARVDDLYDWFRQQMPNFNFSCAHDGGNYANDSVYYAVKAGGGLRVLGQSWEGAREAVTQTTPQMWYVPRTSVATATWAGEIRVGPTQPGPTAGDPWTHPIWEVHRKTGAQDTFNDGDLRLWTDPTGYWYWDNNPMSPITGGDRVATGWQRYLDPAYRSLFTVDSAGRIYAVDASGVLREYNWQPGTKTWRNPAGDVIDSGWGRFDSITASGDGVLYARTPAGNLFRFQYDHNTNTWTQRDKDAGSGWNAYTGITSPGGDILFGSGSKKAGKPVVRWHRYLSEFDTWAPRDQDGLGAVVLADTAMGADNRLQATPNMCSLRR